MKIYIDIYTQQNQSPPNGPFKSVGSRWIRNELFKQTYDNKRLLFFVFYFNKTKLCWTVCTCVVTRRVYFVVERWSWTQLCFIRCKSKCLKSPSRFYINFEKLTLTHSYLYVSCLPSFYLHSFFCFSQRLNNGSEWGCAFARWAFIYIHILPFWICWAFDFIDCIKVCLFGSMSLLLQHSEKVKIIHLNGESDASKKVKIISHFCVCAKSPKVYSFNDYYWSIYVSFSDLVVLNDGSIGLFGSFIQSSSRHGSPKGINTKPNFHLLFSKNAGWFYLFIFLCCVNQFVTISWLIYKINFMLKPKL